jgi:hypothetical protein
MNRVGGYDQNTISRFGNITVKPPVQGIYANKKERKKNTY